METNRAKWGSSRIDPTGIGLMNLENFKPDQRRAELYNRVKRYNEYIAGMPTRECIEFTKELNKWAMSNGYSFQELKQMKIDIRR